VAIKTRPEGRAWSFHRLFILRRFTSIGILPLHDVAPSLALVNKTRQRKIASVLNQAPIRRN
jgi:hypothetical protein